MAGPQPSEELARKIRRYVEHYQAKSGMSANPDPGVTDAVIKGLAANLEEVGRPLCPCNFYPDKKKELEENGRTWLCACDEMKQWKFCHCLLFVTPEGLPITEYLPDDHWARTTYGLVLDPTPLKGREGRGASLPEERNLGK
jgi:ferredoxin-thioredoxin reductase catalytic chain